MPLQQQNIRIIGLMLRFSIKKYFYKATIKRVDFFQWFANLIIDSDMVLIKEVTAPDHVIRSGGYLILMQDQDTLGKFEL